VIVAGHSEYWTNAMRRGLGDAIEQGTNVAFMGANYAYWQVRYEDGGRTMVAYKETGGDPIGNPELVTTRFRNFGQPLRECDLGGVQWWGGSWNIPPADLVVNDTLLGDRWFRGTRIGKGTRLRGVVGGRADTTYGEWDGVVPGCAQGPVSVFFHFDGGPFRKPGADTVRSIAPSGAVVFSSGTHRFSWTLESSVYDRGYASPGMRRFMRNALGDLMRAAPPAVVSVSADRRGASVSVDDPIDPRIVRLSVFARTGQGPWKPYCSGRPPECSGPPLQAGTYRFAAVLGDRWGRSRPLVSEPVVVTGG
jgi:hypothetical protein